jgi:Arc/MetJ-type ribon-helix-helix transcriptional regulator
MRKRDADRLEALRAALIEGEKSGPSKPFDFDKFIARMQARHKMGAKPTGAGGPRRGRSKKA